MIARALADFRSLDWTFCSLRTWETHLPRQLRSWRRPSRCDCDAAEGAEKPRKYPVMFHKADVVLLNKADLAEMSGVDLAELEGNVREVNPDAMIFTLSCRTGAGLDHWTHWLRQSIQSRRVATMNA